MPDKTLNQTSPAPRPLPDAGVHSARTRPARAACLPLATLALSIGLSAFGTGAWAQGSPGGSLFQSNQHMDTKLDDPRPEGGWQALADLLEKVKPGVDTRLDPSAQQVTDHIERLIASNRLPEALALVEKREAQLAARGPRGGGEDVQLQFQHARLLAHLGRTQEAITRYTDLTVLYPELPEPWNNLAALQASQGQLEAAADALTNALRSNPTDQTARSNLADVQLMMAQRSYKQAGQAPKQIPINPDAPTSAAQ